MKNLIIRLVLLVLIALCCILLLKSGVQEVADINKISRNVNDIISFAFLIFLAITVTLYYVLPKKIQWIVLLSASIVFYILSGFQYFVFLASSASITFLVGKKMSKEIAKSKIAIKEKKDPKEKKKLKEKVQRNKRNLLAIALICTLGTMIIIKYSYFIIENINNLLHLEIPLIQLIMPLGLSFYTFMLVAYLVDIYRGKYIAENNFFKFLLFASFFPHISQGPISRYNELGGEAGQLNQKQQFNYKNFCFGLQRILWGFFLKLVLADRLSTFVAGAYTELESQSWLMLVVAAFAFSIQIYVDFYSSMEIAIGSAQLFGIRISENFMRPYFSKNMPEFWRRWHITLGTWFKDYVFYPIAISKILMKFSRWSREKIGSEFSRVVTVIPPIMGVWILTGLWHGAAWNFVAWGIYHGILIVLSAIFAGYIEKSLNKIGINTSSWDYKILQMIKVFILCTIGRVFFVATSLTESIEIFKRIAALQISPNGLINLVNINLVVYDYVIIVIATGMLFVVSTVQEVSGSMREQIDKANIWIRWTIWIFLIATTVLLGVYGEGAPIEFIYERF